MTVWLSSRFEGPLSTHFTTLTAGATVPIRVAGAGGHAVEFDFRVMALVDAEGNAAAAVDLKATFDAELALDVQYLTADVEALVAASHGKLSDDAAREWCSAPASPRGCARASSTA